MNTDTRRPVATADITDPYWLKRVDDGPQKYDAAVSGPDCATGVHRAYLPAAI